MPRRRDSECVSVPWCCVAGGLNFHSAALHPTPPISASIAPFPLAGQLWSLVHTEVNSVRAQEFPVRVPLFPTPAKLIPPAARLSMMRLSSFKPTAGKYRE